jgi:hypothetical protein
MKENHIKHQNVYQTKGAAFNNTASHSFPSPLLQLKASAVIQKNDQGENGGTFINDSDTPIIVWNDQSNCQIISPGQRSGQAEDIDYFFNPLTRTWFRMRGSVTVTFRPGGFEWHMKPGLTSVGIVHQAPQGEVDTIMALGDCSEKVRQAPPTT